MRLIFEHDPVMCGVEFSTVGVDQYSDRFLYCNVSQMQCQLKGQRAATTAMEAERTAKTHCSLFGKEVIKPSYWGLQRRCFTYLIK